MWQKHFDQKIPKLSFQKFHDSLHFVKNTPTKVRPSKRVDQDSLSSYECLQYYFNY